MAALDAIMRGEGAEGTNCADVERLTLRLATMTAAEARRRVQMRELISTSKASEFARAIVRAVISHVSVLDTRERIGEDIGRVTGETPGGHRNLVT